MASGLRRMGNDQRLIRAIPLEWFGDNAACGIITDHARGSAMIPEASLNRPSFSSGMSLFKPLSTILIAGSV